MKNLSILALTACLSLSVYAQDDSPKHLISIGTDGLGWSGSGTTYELDKDKTTRNEQSLSSGEVALNYHYIFPTKFMLGFTVAVDYTKSEIERQNGEKLTEETRTQALGISLGYNFNDDLYNSWWIKAGLASGRLETETEDPADSPSKTTTEFGFGAFSIEAGKRLSFSALKNLSYSPSFALTSISYRDDAKDAGDESSSSVTLNIIKFDLLF